MADGTNFGKAVQKTFSRTKEKVMQNMGKADKTVDEKFDALAAGFAAQQSIATELNTALRNYTKHAKAMSSASQSLFEAFKAAYEVTWPESAMFGSSAEKLETYWLQLLKKLEDTCRSVEQYVEHFHDVKQRMSKRNRKLTDYDSARHNVQALRGSRKPDSFKITKAEEEEAAAKAMYEALNRDVQKELNEVHCSRVKNLCSFFYDALNSESVFHLDSSKVKGQLAQLVQTTADLPQDSTSQSSDEHLVSASSTAQWKFVDSAKHESPYYDAQFNYVNTSSPSSLASSAPMSPTAAVPEVDDQRIPVGVESLYAVPTWNGETRRPSFDRDHLSEAMANFPAAKKVASGSSLDGKKPETVNLSVVPNELYKVMAVFNYDAEDSDELTFVANEVISIVPYDDPDDQDEGWLMGVKVSTGEKGVFPANYTKKI
jgi:amphiphysin